MSLEAQLMRFGMLRRQMRVRPIFERSVAPHFPIMIDTCPGVRARGSESNQEPNYNTRIFALASFSKTSEN
jgi:hypothetical protein